MTQLVSASAESVERATEILRGGGVVAFPTETVYGLGAAAHLPQAVARIYAAKGRPSFNPLIAHVNSVEAAQREAILPAAALRLARAFWPGPLTLVAAVAADGGVCDLARAGLASIALRVPAHETAQALIAALGAPIVAPSANRSGHVSPVTAEHVAQDLDGKVDLILDGGRTMAGLESTIVSFLGAAPVLLRPGALSREALEEALGGRLAASADAGVVAPGMTASHYAPRARLRLAATDVEPGEAVLDFGGRLAAAPDTLCLDLSPRGDLVEAAANLYAHLRILDAQDCARIAVAPIPATGLGEAINDRLRRAASPR